MTLNARSAYIFAGALAAILALAAPLSRAQELRAQESHTQELKQTRQRLAWSDSSSGDRNARAYRANGPTGPSRPGDFDYYVFSLSWSPGFCATHERAQQKAQSENGSRFVVHGLWPQYEHGFPQDCGRHSRPLPSYAFNAAEGLFPDKKLARHEWRKHGTCSGESPQDYFGNVKKARDQIVIPQQLANAAQAQNIDPDEILRAFAKANPRLQPGMAAVICQDGVLQEVRFCMTRDVSNFRPCPEVANHSCRARSIQIPTP